MARAKHGNLCLALGCLLLLVATPGILFAKDVERKPFTFAKPLHFALEPDVNASFSVPEFADLNGDGRVDIVSINGQEPYRPLRLAVYLSRPGGFDTPLYIEPQNCTPHFQLIDSDSDHEKEILVVCSHITYSSAEYWAQVYDIGSDASVHPGPRLDIPELPLASPKVVDLDQDGLEDILFNVRWTNAPWVFRTVVYYNRGSGAWHHVVGPEFSPPGYDITLPDPPLEYHFNGTDLDGDGAKDIMWGVCPKPCMIEQEPWGQIVGAPISGTEYYANSTSFGDIDGDGAQDFSLGGQIWLQTSDRKFELALEVQGLYNSANAKIADFDLNGLADWVTMDADYFVWLSQVAPGEFELHWFPIPSNNGQGNNDVQIADVDADGCPDVVLPYMANGFWMFRGMNCVNASNLEILLSTTGSAVTTIINHVRGPDTMKGQVVRVVLAPQIQDDTPLGVQVTPPPGCISVQLRAPRRAFDCLLPDIAPLAKLTLQFKVAYAGVVNSSVPMQATAMLLDSAGDVDKADNRAFTRFYVRPSPPPLTGSRRLLKKSGLATPRVPKVPQ